MTERVSRDQEGGLQAALFVLRQTPMSRALALCAFCLSLVASFALPNHYVPWPAAQQDMAAACAMLVALATAAAWTGRLFWPRVSLFFLAVAAVPLLQYLAGKIWFFGDAWIASLYLLAASIAAVSGYALRRHRTFQAVPILAAGLLAAGLLSCILALAQRFSVSWGPVSLFLVDLQPRHAPFANLAQPNQFAMLLACSLASLGLLFERNRVNGGWAVVAGMLLIACLGLTQSRAAMLMMLVLGGWYAAYRRQLALKTPAVVVLGAMALWVLSYLAWPTLTELTKAGEMVTLESRLQPGPRTIIWAQMLEAVLRQPWTGYGWNQVSVAQLAVAADFGTSRFTEHSHNLLLDLMVWCGVPLAALICVVAARWARDRLRAVTTVDGGFASLLVLLLLVHSAVEFPLEYLYFLIPFGWAVGALDAEGTPRPVVSMPRAAGGALVFLAAAITVIASADYLRFEEAYRHLRYAAARIGRPLVHPGDSAPATEFTQLGAYFRLALTPPRRAMSAQEREWIGRVTARYPYVPALFRWAVVQAIHGDTAGALHTLAQLRRLHGEVNYATAKGDWAALSEVYPELRAVHLP